MSQDYIVATTKRWNFDAFNTHTRQLPGDWHLVTSKDELAEALERLNPRYIFFPHWSWVVPAEIVRRHECVCFHMTDVPFGRGGSPLQNLIVRGHKDTRLSALRMVEEVDAGPVYVKADLSLSGRAQEIYERATILVFHLIGEIVTTEPTPEKQQGVPCWFDRRTPAQSEFPCDADLASLYDHIRMLDAEDYPAAFIEWNNYRLEFEDACLESGKINARVKITRLGERY